MRKPKNSLKPWQFHKDMIKFISVHWNKLLSDRKGWSRVHRLNTDSKGVGIKQTLRALEKEQVAVLYVANDAQKQVTIRALQLAESQNLPIVYVDTMEELGKVCDVEVKTATAALIK